jgi:alanyl-tRNA synthetase
VAAISAALSVKQPEVAQGVERLKQVLADTEFALTGAKRALAAEKIKAMPETPGNLCLFEEGMDPNTLRSLVNAGMEKCGGICAAFTGSDESGYRYVMGSRTVDLRAESKVIHAALGGKGGGQPAMIQGSVPAKRAEIEAYFA